MAVLVPQIFRVGKAERGVARALAAALACSVAFGAQQACAIEIFGFKFFETEQEEIVDPLNFTLTFTVAGEEDGGLEGRLKRVSALVAEEDQPVPGSLGLLSRARSDREQIVAALYRDARYDGVVEIRIAGQLLDDIPPDTVFPSPPPVPVSITVTPGRKFSLGRIALKGDAASLNAGDYALEPGGDASSTTILRAEGLMVKALKDGGRPLARVGDRSIVADHDRLAVDVTLTMEAGPVAGYGPTSVEGTQLVDREFTRYMTGLPEGQTYSPDEVEDARQRLVDLQVFSSATVKEAAALDANGNIPIDVKVSERKMRFFGLGASFSSTEGAAVEGYWGHRNLFGRAERLRVEGSIGGIGNQGVEGFTVEDLKKLNYNAAILFEKPGVIGPDSRFFANTRTLLEHPDAYDRFSSRTGVGLSYELTRTQKVSAEFAVEYSDIDDAFGSYEYLLISTPFQYEFDNRDNRLNPTGGIRAVAFLEPTYDALSSTAFLKAKGDLSAYLGLDDADRFILAGRLSTGSVIGAQINDVPADRRFYSGGGGSVRGYAFQGIGPRNGFGTPTGGLSYAEASLELRFGISDNFGLVPFIDAGTVSLKEYPDFKDVKVGAGLGVRYNTPFGPLRVDFGVPLNPEPDDPSFAIYAGVGQAF